MSDLGQSRKNMHQRQEPFPALQLKEIMASSGTMQEERKQEEFLPHSEKGEGKEQGIADVIIS